MPATSVLRPAALRSLLREALPQLRAERGAGVFVGKAMLSMYLALGLALLLQLPSPSTSMLTVLVVMNGQSGMVMAKSFYRILGTFVGVTAAVTIVALFPQQPLLMLAAIALWAGICAAGSLMQRGFRSYAFVLSGYTVAMIVLPVVNQPQAIFSVAVHRFIEVLLGLGVTTLVFDGLFPQQMAAQVKQLAISNKDYLLQEIRTVLAGQPQAPGPLHMVSSQKASGFEDLINTAMFEGPWLSQRSSALKRSNHDFMQTVTRLQAYQRLTRRLQQQPSEAASLLQQLAQPLWQRLQQDCSDSPRLLHDLQQLHDAIDNNRKQLAANAGQDTQQAFATGAALLYRVSRSLLRFLQALTVARHDVQATLPAPRFSRIYDPLSVAVSALRTSAVTFAVGLLWIASGWSSGATGMFIVVALSMMLSPLPNPVAAVRLAAAGHTVAPFIALLCFSILPSLTSFPLLIAGTAPFLMLMLYLVTVPGWAGFAIPLNFGFMVALNISHYASSDYGHFFNEMIATLFGVALVSAGFLLFPGINGSAGQRHRFLHQLDRSIRMAAHAPLPGLTEKLESRNRDISTQLAAQLPADSAAAEAFTAQAMRTQEACYVLLSLREDLTCADQPRLQTLIDAVAQHWQDGTVTEHGHRLLNLLLADAFAALPADASAVREHLYLLTDVLDEQLSTQPAHSGDVIHAR